MCPEKKIEAYTRDSLADSFKGQTLTAMGLQDYIKHRIDGEGLWEKRNYHVEKGKWN